VDPLGQHQLYDSIAAQQMSSGWQQVLSPSPLRSQHTNPGSQQNANELQRELAMLEREDKLNSRG
jgi:hypothetical protein